MERCHHPFVLMAISNASGMRFRFSINKWRRPRSEASQHEGKSAAQGKKQRYVHLSAADYEQVQLIV